MEEIKTLEGNLSAGNLKFAIIESRFNDFVSCKLREGAIDALRRHGARDADIDLVKVPGAFELALAAEKIADRYDALICLGAVIRGDTPHFDFVAAETAKGIAHVSLKSGKPVVFGVITADNLEQAIERAGTKRGNKGFDAAVSAIEMANLLKKL